jgi:hypothetical protein
MSTTEDDKHLHINIYKDNGVNKGKIEDASNKSEMYLILMNEELNNKNRNYLDDLNTSKQENDTLTEDNERMEKSITYQRGLLHNFHSINNNRKELNDIQNNIVLLNKTYIKDISKLYINYSYFIQLFLYCYVSTLVLLFGVGFITLYDTFIFNSIVGLSSFITVIFTKFDYNSTFNTIHNNYKMDYEKLRDHLKISQKKIDDMDKNNEHITEFIDVV